jgi:flagellar hook protein FlgE
LAGEISTIQSLKAVDAWIDVINANINGGVRTAFKSSRLKFAGSNVDIVRAGTGTSLPLQMPEAGLTTANTVIDFSQGAVTASTENSHLAVQGEGFFLLAEPAEIQADGTLRAAQATSKIYCSRDGEFRTNQNGLLVHSSGLVLITCSLGVANLFFYHSNTLFGTASQLRAVYNNLDTTTNATTATKAVRLTDFLANSMTSTTVLADGVSTLGANASSGCFSLMKVGAKQRLQFSRYGSTVYDFGHYWDPVALESWTGTGMATTPGKSSDATVLSKSLEASNASMTQSVPELSLAQKLFSALTKVLQTKQTNIDGVLNLVR